MARKAMMSAASSVRMMARAREGVGGRRNGGVEGRRGGAEGARWSVTASPSSTWSSVELSRQEALLAATGGSKV